MHTHRDGFCLRPFGLGAPARDDPAAATGAALVAVAEDPGADAARGTQDVAEPSGEPARPAERVRVGGVGALPTLLLAALATRRRRRRARPERQGASGQPTASTA